MREMPTRHVEIERRRPEHVFINELAKKRRKKTDL
jgi:hypothetical protein